MKKATIIAAGILAAAALTFPFFRIGRHSDQVFRNGGEIPLSETVWKLVWSDEFDSDSLNLEYWSYDVGKGVWGNREAEYYTEGENLTVEDGCLKITAEYNPDNEERQYTSSRILTRRKVSFAFGRIEARIKLPAGQGCWPAFWAMGNAYSYTWPACGELDIMEAINTCDVTHGTFHWGVQTEKGQEPKNYKVISSQTGMMDIPDRGDWHCYAVEWNAEEIRWLLDDEVFHSVALEPDNGSQAVFSEPFYLILNLAVGGNWPGEPDPGVFPQSMYVDYVRVYKAEKR